MSRRLLLALLALAPAWPQAVADETLVAYLFKQRFPQSQVENVAKAPVADLYEVYADGRLWYVDSAVEYVFQGTLTEVRSRRNMTEERLKRLLAVPLDRLPLDLSFQVVRGNGSRRLAVFTDPECGACRDLERELARVANTTIHVFLLPQEQLHRGSTVISTRIWCAEDPGQAWVDSMVQGQAAQGPEGCITPLPQIAELARRLRIAGTPTMIFADGTRIAGAVSARTIDETLDAVQRRAATARTE